MVARIHAIIRRSQGHSQSIICTGRIAVNLDAKTVEVDGARVHLTGKEYQILELLSLRKGTTLTKEMFLNHLYGGMDEPELKIDWSFHPQDVVHRDEYTRLPLAHGATLQAQEDELKYMDHLDVWENASEELCIQRAGKKPFPMRWVLCNRGGGGGAPPGPRPPGKKSKYIVLGLLTEAEKMSAPCPSYSVLLV